MAAKAGRRVRQIGSFKIPSSFIFGGIVVAVLAGVVHASSYIAPTVEFDRNAAASSTGAFAMQPRLPVLDKKAYDQKIDRKSTRLNSSHSQISYAVFCF